METLQRLPFKARKAVFNKLEEIVDIIVDIASLSKADRMKYDESIKIYRDNLAIMAFERNQGREEGKKEERLEIARKMKALGIAEETIVLVTDLTAEEVAQL